VAIQNLGIDLIKAALIRWDGFFISR